MSSSVLRSGRDRQQPPPRKRRRVSQSRVIDITSDDEGSPINQIIDGAGNSAIPLANQHRDVQEPEGDDDDDEIQILSVNDNTPTALTNLSREGSVGNNNRDFDGNNQTNQMGGDISNEDDDIEIVDVREASEPLRSQPPHIDTPYGPFIYEVRNLHNSRQDFSEIPLRTLYASFMNEPSPRPAEPSQQRNLRSSRTTRSTTTHPDQTQATSRRGRGRGRSSGRGRGAANRSNPPRERSHHNTNLTQLQQQHHQNLQMHMPEQYRSFITRSLERINQLHFQLGNPYFDSDFENFEDYDSDDIAQMSDSERDIMRRIEEDNNRTLNARSDRESKFNQKTMLEKKQASDRLNKSKNYTTTISSKELLICELCGIELGEGSPEGFKSNTEYDKNFEKHSMNLNVQAPWFCTNPFTAIDAILSKRVFASKCGHCFCGRCVKNIANRSKKVPKDSPKGFTIKNPNIFAPPKCPAKDCGKRFVSKAFTEIYF